MSQFKLITCHKFINILPKVLNLLNDDATISIWFVGPFDEHKDSITTDSDMCCTSYGQNVTIKANVTTTAPINVSI